MSNHDYRRVVRFTSADEKLASLADRGIFLLDDEISDCSYHMMALFLFNIAINPTLSTIWIILNSPGGRGCCSRICYV